jgi:hypothetical protein
MNDIKPLPNVKRSHPVEWMDLLWDIIWDYEDCKHRNGEIKNYENFKILMDEVKTVMAWIEEDLEIERDMYKTEYD